MTGLWTKRRGVGRFLLLATLGVNAVACGDDVTAPSSRALRVSASGAALIGDPDPAMVSTLLDSFSIGGVYTVLPTGGYGGGMTYSTRLGSAETILRHPTGIVLPSGLPVRLLAEGVVVSTATPAFQSTWCPSTPEQSTLCDAESISYSVHGLVPGPGVSLPYQEGTGLRLQWLRLAPFAEQYWSADPAEAQFFRGVVPGGDTIAAPELHFRRSGCCYFLGASGESLEQYAGSWRFGAVPDDGSRPEVGVPAEIVMYGPRTDAAMDAPATFRVAHVADLPLTEARWWYITPASNTFDGTAVNAASPGTLPKYPDDRRTGIVEVTECAGQRECVYQAGGAGALIVRLTAGVGTLLAARNTGASSSAAIELVLTCTSGPSRVSNGQELVIERGASVDCLASPSSGATEAINVQDWTYAAPQIPFSTSRALTGTLLEEPLRWRGEVVVSGTLAVSALLGSETVPKSASITLKVNSRSWTNRLPIGYPDPIVVGQRGTRYSLPTVPREDADLGKVEHPPRIAFREQGAGIGILTSGPNNGLAYVRAIPLLIGPIEILINDEALTSHSVFWQGQLETAPAFSADPFCTRTVVTASATRRKILEHEGLSFAPGSHTQRFRAEYQRVVGAEMERLVREHDLMASVFEMLAEDLYDRAAAAGAKTDTLNKVNLGCNFNYDLQRRQ